MKLYGPKIQINKYSINELKLGIDLVIDYYLNFEYFEENLKLNNMKISFVILTIFCCLIAHIFSRRFPEYYYILLFSIIFYAIFKTLYWLIENKLLGDIFFIGNNEHYYKKYRNKKNQKYTIKEIKFHSKMDEKNPSIYLIWFDFILLEDNKIIKSIKRKIDCTKVYDERGYIYANRVIRSFKSIFKKEIQKIE